MNFELKAAKEKWEREQKQRKEQAKARLDREKKAKEEAARLREALETAQRTRRIQEAEAAEAARRQEENDLAVGDGVRFNVMLQAKLVSGEGDKINLPPSAFEQLSSEGALEKGPMFFEVSAANAFPQTHPSVREDENDDVILYTSTTSGVLQFTASEGFAELPPHVWKNAGLSGGSDAAPSGLPSVRVRYVRLSKCTYAKLLPDASDFSDVPNHKAVLETKLRQHATLSEGDELLVQHGVNSYSLRVMQLKPDSSVSVLDTDMEVDVVQTAFVPGSDTQSRLAPLQIGKPVCGSVKEGDYVYFKFSVDQKMVDSVNRGEIDLTVHLDVDDWGTTSDADLYVAAHPLLFPTQHQHHWASHDLGSKVIHLACPGKTLTSNSYSIGVYGYQGNAEFKICVRSQAHRDVSGQKLGISSSQEKQNIHFQEGFAMCSNCTQAIPSRTIALHEAYCRRHNIVCKHPSCGAVLRQEEFKKHTHCSTCGQSLKVEELQKHVKIFHEPQYCRCGVLLQREEMVNHQANSCPFRMITCRFCGDMIQAGTEVEDLRDKLRGLTQHESLCGSRTASCDVCGRSIMMKEMDLHKIAAHGANSDFHGNNPSASSLSIVQSEYNPSTFIHPPAHSDLFEFMCCPICSHAFEGLDAAAQLNKHLDNEHFMESGPVAAKLNKHLDNERYLDSGAVVSSEVTPGVEMSIPGSSSAFRSSLSVSCPICGLSVHSERDLSLHIDMVH